MDIQKETYKVLGQRILSPFNSIELVNWSVKLLENGYESESSIILAGLDKDSTEEREKYFWKSIVELNIETAKTDSELVEYYLENISEESDKGIKTATDLISAMRNVLLWSGYDSKYYQFIALDEDVDYLENYGGVIYNTGLRLENKDQFIKDELKLFLEIERLKIDDATREKSICNFCGEITKPKLKNKYQLKRPCKYQTYVCGNCGSEKIEHFSTQNGKRKIIERIKNHT